MSTKETITTNTSLLGMIVTTKALRVASSAAHEHEPKCDKKAEFPLAM